MPNSIVRSYSAHAREATQLLGHLISAARKERKLTAQEVADRAGISRGLPNTPGQNGLSPCLLTGG